MGMDWGAVAGGFSDGLHRNREAAMRNRQVQLQEARDARESELHAFRVSEASDREDERARLRRANAAAAEFAANYGRQPEAARPPEAAEPGLTRVSPAAQGGMPEEGSAWGQGTTQAARDPDRVIAAATYANPGRLRRADYLNGMMQIYAKEGLADKVKPYFEELYRTEEQGGVSAAIALTQNNPDLAFQINQQRASRKYAKPPELVTEGPDRGKWRVTYQDGESSVQDARAAVLTSLEPSKALETMFKIGEDDRKKEESRAKIAEHEARTGLIEAQRDFTAGARTIQANAQASRSQRPPESKESVDRAHQFVDAQLQRLATATEGGRPVIDEVTKKPVVDQARLNSLYTLHNEVQLQVEELLGRELTSREIRVLGQRMASAPLGDTAAGKKWALETVRSMVSRPSTGATSQQQGSAQPTPPVPGARLAQHPQTGEKGWAFEDENGRTLWRPINGQQATSSTVASQARTSVAAPATPPTSAAPAATRSPAATQAPARAPAVDEATASLNSTKSRLESAERALQRYSMRDRKVDAAGYAKARSAYEEALASATEAEKVFRSVAGDKAVFDRGRTPGYADGGLVRRSGMTTGRPSAVASHADDGLTRRRG